VQRDPVIQAAAKEHTLRIKLRYNVLFDSIKEDQLAKILEATEEITLPSGSVVFEENSEGNSLYLIVNGSVKISKILPSGEETFLGILHSGDFFGELELIDNRPRSAQATAVTDCTLGRLDKVEVEKLLAESPLFARNLLKMLSLRLRSTNVHFIQQLKDNLESARAQIDRMNSLFEASKTVNSSLDLDNLLGIILHAATSSVHADSGTVYLVDDSTREIWSKVLDGSTRVEIRLPLGKGIAGYVAATGETINLPDAYADPRFNPDIDRASGYKTHTVLCMPMRNKGGKIIGAIQLLNKKSGVFDTADEEFIDALSAHAAIAVENAQLALQMIQSERLSAVGSMANTIIHDIKNPLGMLRMYAQIMKKKSADAETLKLADQMVSQIDRFVKMTQEILDFSRGVSELKIEPVGVHDYMEIVLAMIEADLNARNINLISKMYLTGNVKLDQEKMARVFYNVASNAADAMSKGGHLTVTTSAKEGFVVFEFMDDGAGIAENVKSKIFQPFFTHGKKHGTGLGMAIVKRIVDDHKGKIEIESVVGKGTTVRILIPA
jgi:signal transduction histidine kinase/CRP-like cAMP-binding protein